MLLASAAQAGNGWWYEPPPKRYDFEPIIPWTIVPTRQASLNAICADGLTNKNNGGVVACSRVVPFNTKHGLTNICIIFWPYPFPAKLDRKQVLRHEMGHCNGWSNRHEE
jgi:hypothetical protein